MRLQSLRLTDGRRLTLYLPTPARARPTRPYPLLILHDGQNLFEPDRAFVKGQHWRAGETADELIAAGLIPPLVICGIDHAGEGRIDEMTPTRNANGRGGGVQAYGDMIVNDVLPLIRAEVPVRTDRGGTALGGSSLGGLATLAILLDHPGVFGSAIVMSPSVWWDRRAILRRIAKEPESLAGMRLWIDIGLAEGAKAIDDARRLAKVVERAATPAAVLNGPGPRKTPTPLLEVRYVEEPAADHSEKSWAARFGRALTYIFAP